MSFNQIIKLEEVAVYSSSKIVVKNVDEDNYISTENLIPNYGGKTVSSGLPNVNSVTEYRVDDVLISNIRPYFKKIWRAGYKGGASNDVLVVSPKPNILPKFLYYSLANDKFFDYVMSGAKGTKMPRGDKSHIMGYQFNLPSVNEQEYIAHILSTLDEKIEVNNQINKTLENMAQAIFKQWFVDFEFPNVDGEPYKSSGGEMVESELGVIPKGWEVKEISNLISVKDGTHDSPKAKNEGYHLITSKHLKENIIDFNSANLISDLDYENINKRSKVDRYDILITMIGTVGNIYLVQNEKINFAIKNIGLFKTSENTELYEYLYIYLKSERITQYINERLAGSTQKYVSLTELRKIPVLVCSSTILKKYKRISHDIFDSIYNNSKETKKMELLRDTLLPKLMSGEIRVPMDI
ncbi:restriction endonuclease subunit S [Clostridium sp. CS001]|uniref:restriction endonuclease subunit S n=1 Tax=Clostridium sp. CS001 TaxID=2880648 RepID=UPI001CF20ED2|nr:restriction endonuclease subunit S [Clostridium sp. CS001]MCB2291018.1 restriction endonuclease subunit S [Clostridium sp. CS001]